MFSPILEMYSKLLVPSFHPIHHHWCHLLLFSSSTNGFEREGIPPLLGLALFLAGERRWSCPWRQPWHQITRKTHNEDGRETRESIVLSMLWRSCWHSPQYFVQLTLSPMERARLELTTLEDPKTFHKQSNTSKW